MRGNIFGSTDPAPFGNRMKHIKTCRLRFVAAVAFPIVTVLAMAVSLLRFTFSISWSFLYQVILNRRSYNCVDALCALDATTTLLILTISNDSGPWTL